MKSVIASFGFFSLVAAAEVVGDKASYLAPEKCPPVARAIIESLKLPKQQIHRCTESRDASVGRSWAELQFGPAQDCPAGCFYDSVTALFDGKSEASAVLPMSSNAALTGSLRLPRFDEIAQKPELNCKFEGLSKVTPQLAEQNGRWGWRLDLPPGLDCRTGDGQQWTWSGTAFAFVESFDKRHETRWDLRGIKVSESRAP